MIQAKLFCDLLALQSKSKGFISNREREPGNLSFAPSDLLSIVLHPALCLQSLVCVNNINVFLILYFPGGLGL